MSDVAIRVGGLGKLYRIGKRERYKTLRDTLTETATAPLRWIRSLGRSSEVVETEAQSDRFWALRDVSFEVPRGAVVGIVGRNGAGKSTLLRILSRITEPTEGRVEIHGRVGSLLEVGTGFHPELTGRENIFLNGAILGMHRTEIARKFDEIVEFAEVDKFIDTPVKHYSSGMYMRLAFAVAAHLEPEILVIDEVLAVGDAQFQEKCLGKMGDVAREGRTVLFVSHNMVAVNSLCSRAVCFSFGRVVHQGDASNVVAGYLRHQSKPASSSRWTDATPMPGDGVGRLNQVQILTRRSPADYIPLENPIEIEVTYSIDVPEALVNVSLVLCTAEQICVFNTISPPTRRLMGRVRETCEIPANLLNAGIYRVRVLLVRDTTSIFVDVPDALSFEMFETHRSVNWYGQWIGLLRPSLPWRSESSPAEKERVIAC